MQAIKDVITNAHPVTSTSHAQSPYRGSEATYEAVKAQIRERWGDECADEFNPYSDVMPFSSWIFHGFRVRKGEKALKSITFIEVKDENDKVIKKIKRKVNLFHKRQIEKVA